MMTKKEQQALANELATQFVAEYLEMASRAPDGWTGFELRQLLVDCAKERFEINIGRAGMQSYRNDRLVTSGL